MKMHASELDAETFEDAAARVAAMGIGAPERSPRSDKGTKRTPKAQTVSMETLGAMSTDQTEELIRLVGARAETLKKWEEAQREAQMCEIDFKLSAKALQDFIEALAK
jgi:hypothetical protein